MKLAWITDPHFNFIPEARFREFVDSVAAHQPDAVLVGGDIAEALDVTRFLREMAETLGRPIYFVLGNHDYYRSSIAVVRRRIRELCAENKHLIYLSEAEAVSLSGAVGLVGHDGWADGRLGNYQRSMVMLSDHILIHDLQNLGKSRRLEALNRLGDEAGAHLGAVLPTALDRHVSVIVLTHVPPFREACWHQDHVAGDLWLPHMTCQSAGAAIEAAMRDRPDKQLTVLCGHTHSAGEARIGKNVHVITGSAEYGSPAVARVWETP